VAGVYLSDPISPPLHTVYVKTVYLFTQGRGREGKQTSEKVRVATVHKAGSKIPA
jgi:hypothetical protein